MTYPGGRVVERTEDAAGRPFGFATDGMGAFGVSWTADRMVDAGLYPCGVATDYTHDLHCRVADISVTAAAGNTPHLVYAYRPGSLVQSRSTGRDGALPVAETMTGDATARLSTVSSMSSGVPVQYTGSHEPLELPDGSTLAFSSLGVPEGLTSGGVTTTWGYDAAGRRSTESIGETTTRQYTWDARGTLGGVVDPPVGLDVGFEYSGGLRVAASGVNATGVVDASYVWQTVSAVPLLLGDGDFEYVYGAGSAPVAQVDTVTGGVTFLHGDVVGSTRVVTDASGGVVAEFDYGMYGSRDVVSGDADANGTAPGLVDS